MKILVSRGLYDKHLGGAEIEVIDFVKSLFNDGHSVVLVTNSLDLIEKVGSNAKAIKVEWPRTQSNSALTRALLIPLRFVRFSKVLVATARKERVDLITSESREDGIVFAFSRSLHHSPLLWRDHADLRHQLRQHRNNILARIYQLTLVRALRKTDAIVTVSQYDADHIDKFVNKSNLVHIIHPGTVVGKRDALKGKRSSSKVPVIGVVSRLVRDKGIQHLINAVSLLPNNSYKLVVVGDGPYKDKLEDMVNKLDVNAQFVGYADTPDKFYESFDIFVQPSLYEGWSKTVIEAMLHELPVLASDIPSHREQIDTGINGLLFKEEDVEDLRAALVKLLSDNNLRTKLGNNARRKASRIGNFELIYSSQYAPLLKELAN